MKYEQYFVATMAALFGNHPGSWYLCWKIRLIYWALAPRKHTWRANIINLCQIEAELEKLTILSFVIFLWPTFGKLLQVGHVYSQFGIFVTERQIENEYMSNKYYHVHSLITWSCEPFNPWMEQFSQTPKHSNLNQIYWTMLCLKCIF